MNDNEVRKAPDALERVPEMLDTPPNRYHCISKTPQQTLGAFFVVDTNVGSNRPSSMSVSLLKNAMSTDILQNCRFCGKKDLVQRSGNSRGVVTINGYIISKKTILAIVFFNRQAPQRYGYRSFSPELFHGKTLSG